MPANELKLIHQGSEFEIYKLNRNQIIKVARSGGTGINQQARLDTEWNILQGLDLPGIRKVISQDLHDGRQAVTFEYIPGTSLYEQFEKGSADITAFLEQAIDSTANIRTLHEAGIIHGRINPHHLLLTRKNQGTVIIGLGCSHKTGGESIPAPKVEEFTPAELLYIAPEQTGRTDQEISFSTDLYSLGTVFYHHLTGKPPFVLEDPMELVHAHIAKVPASVQSLRKEIPKSISDILQKLLNKIPAERYHSADELVQDLQACLNEWRSKGSIDEDVISIGQQFDVLETELPIVGRDEDSRRLEEIFERARSGNFEVVLIEGESGVGKTVFGKSIKEQTIESSGFFLEGKFDEYQQGIPYAGLSQCFRQFVNILLTKDQETLDYWKSRITEGVGPLAGVLINLIPELNWIVEGQQQVSMLVGQEAINRLRYAVRRFIQVIAHKNHPVVFLVDDIQWADLDTLNLIENILSDPQVSHLMMIGTFRHNTLEEGDPVLNKLIDLRSTLKEDSSIRLGNLRERDIQQLMKGMLEGEVENREQLVNHILELTKGNALHVTQFLNTLVSERILNLVDNKWRWKQAQIDQLEIAGDLRGLMYNRVQRISPEAMRMLSLAACVGNRFEGMILDSLSKEQNVGHLEEAVREGLLTTTESGDPQKSASYQFAHDSIRELAYEQLSSEERADKHMQIGEFWLETLSLEEKEDRIFDVVTQFNLGKSGIQSPVLNDRNALLNLEAGQKAKSSAAFGPAYQYMMEGIHHLGEDPWKNYDLALQLFGNAAELASLNGDYEALQELCEGALKNVQKVLDEKQFMMADLNASMAQKKPGEALNIALDYLRRLGHRLPRKGSKLTALWGLVTMNLKMRGKTADELVALPKNTEPGEITALEFLRRALTAAYFVEPDLLTGMIAKILSISLRHGNAPESAAGYMGYGFIHSGYLNSFDRGFEFGKLSTRVLEGLDRDEIYHVFAFQDNIFCKHWKEPIPEVINNLDRSYHQLLNVGDFETAAFAIHSYLYFTFYLGWDLNHLKKRCDEIVAVVSTLNQPTTLHRIQMYQQAILNLLGESRNPHLLKGSAYDEEKMIPVHYEDKISIAIHNVHFLKAYMAFLFNENEVAQAQLLKAKEYNEAAAASYFVPLFEFLSALVYCSEPANKNKVRSHLKRLKKYADNAPLNYQRYHTLARAEYARITGKESEARVLYDDAIYQSRQAGNPLDEALGWELAGKFYLQIERQDKASTCFKYAYDNHLRWGASAKAEQVANTYGEMINLAKTVSSSDLQPELASTGSLDMFSMVKSLQALSTELDLNRLLNKMMDILIENAGADRGLLIMDRQGEWDIIAERDINNEGVSLLEGERLQSADVEDEKSLVPAGIVHYVIRTRRTTVINDVQRDVQFADLPYVQLRKPRSLLCMPLLNHNQLIGIVYLENTLAAGAFTQNIQEGLKLQSRQLAIALENAMLYEDLEDKVVQNRDLVSKLQVKVEEQEKTLKVFGQFVPGQVVKKTLESKTEMSMLEGEQREVAVMFCDIRDFTPISEELKPANVVDLLNEFYAVMTEIIQKHSGTVTLFIGDEIMAAFGVPVASKKNEQNAVLCALEMTEAIPDLNKIYKERFDREIRIGIGINSGSVVAGILGSKAKLAYSITGDTVNTAKRIESLTKDLDNGIVISESVYKKCMGIIEASRWDPVQVKGKKEKINVYEVMGKK